jgi:undecaprenyl-diphosphatase
MVRRSDNSVAACDQSGTSWIGAGGACAWRRLAVWSVLALAALLLSAAYIDLEATRWARWPGLDPLRSAFEIISEFGRGLWYVIALLALIPLLLRTGAQRPARLATLMLIALFVTGVIVQLIKPLVGRQRPKSLYDDGIDGFDWITAWYESSSFPSGHTATIAVVAAVMWIAVPRWRDMWIACVALVGVSRVLDGAHYPSDVIAGAFIGAGTTFLVARALRSRPWPQFFGKSRPTTMSVIQSPVE